MRLRNTHHLLRIPGKTCKVLFKTDNCERKTHFMRLLLSSFLASSMALSTALASDEVHTRVVDVGGGLCTITSIPGDHYMIYDGGHWTGKNCLKAAQDMIEGDQIDLMIISHADSDHLGEVPEILAEYNVEKIYRTGFPRWDTKTWKEANKAISEEALHGATVINLQTTELEPGTELKLGDATVTFIAGWGEWTKTTGPTKSELRNAVSIVARLEYDGKSILFTGDTVGRRKNDPETGCKDAEKFMVDNANNVPIKSTVMIAPHHGGNNGSSTCFIKKVAPEYVIFSAGHKHHHPTNGVAKRYLANGVLKENIFRTDRGDDEPLKDPNKGRTNLDEWDHERKIACKDKAGDDAIDIKLPKNGSVLIKYNKESTGCPNA